MQFINPLLLVTIKNTVNEIGDNIQSESIRKVYCDINSVRQTEFYQAQANGYKAELSVIVRDFEYKNEEIAEFNSIRYKILRSYDKKDGTIELTLIRGVEDASSKEHCQV